MERHWVVTQGRDRGIRQLGRKHLVKKDRTAGHWKAYSSKGGGTSEDNPQEEAESREAPKASRNPDRWPRVCTKGRGPQNRPSGDDKHQAPTFSTPPASSRPLGDAELDNCTGAQESPQQDTLRLQQRRRAARTHRRAG